MLITQRHRDLLERIGADGASSAELRSEAKSFAELVLAKLIVYWRAGDPRPAVAFGAAAKPDRWYLTREAAEVLRASD